MSASPRKEFIYGNKKEKSAFTCQACEITTEEKSCFAEKYEKRLKVARKKDFFRRLRNVILILAIAFCALFAAGNLMLKKATRTDIDRLYAGSKRSG